MRCVSKVFMVKLSIGVGSDHLRLTSSTRTAVKVKGPKLEGPSDTVGVGLEVIGSHHHGGGAQ